LPTFCRHNRLVQNCPICSREQAIEMRPIISSGTPATSEPRRPAAPRPRRTGAPGLRVSRLARGADDGYRLPLVPGLRSSEDAERLAAEFAFAATRLQVLADDPPGCYAEVRGDAQDGTWLAFLIAYLGPLDEADPFIEIRRVYESGALPDDVRTGPRGAPDPARGARTLEAYRAWVQRAGSQAAAFVGEQAWTPERRFARVFERLALPGLHRDARFDLLVTLGALGVYELQAGSLQLGGTDTVTVAAKRVLGIGDSILLERRAAALAQACEVPLAALDLGFYNWERGERATMGLGIGSEPDATLLERARSGLGL
jgi:hypothetical protein